MISRSTERDFGHRESFYYIAANHGEAGVPARPERTPVGLAIRESSGTVLWRCEFHKIRKTTGEDARRSISHQPSATSHQPSATSHQPQAISALLHLLHAHNLRGCVELSVILVGDVLVYVEVLHERESYVDVYRNVPRQPDFIVDPRGIDDDPRPLVDARQK